MRDLIGSAFVTGLGIGALGGIVGLAALLIGQVWFVDDWEIALVAIMVAVPFAAAVGALVGATLCVVSTSCLFFTRQERRVGQLLPWLAGLATLAVMLPISMQFVWPTPLIALAAVPINTIATAVLLRSSSLVVELAWARRS